MRQRLTRDQAFNTIYDIHVFWGIWPIGIWVLSSWFTAPSEEEAMRHFEEVRDKKFWRGRKVLAER